MKIFFKFFEKWISLLRAPMLTILMILLAIVTSFVENRELPDIFRDRLRHIRHMLKYDETIYPAILYRYLPTEFPMEVAANRYAAVPRIVQFIDQIRMTPFLSEINHRVMSREEFWQVIERQLPEMREQAAAAMENQNREIELFFQQPFLGTLRIKRMLADFCDEFANILNRTVTNGEIFRSLRTDIDAYRNGHFDANSEQWIQCARVKYLTTILQWCEIEANRRGIDARLDDPDQHSRDIAKFLSPRRRNADSNTERYLSRIDSHFWSNSNSPNVSLLARFLFNLRMAPNRVTNTQNFTQLILREFARQQVRNRNPSFVIGQPRAGPPFSRYRQLTVSIPEAIRYLMAEADNISIIMEDGLRVAKYSDLFESLRNDYWRYENAQDENARNEMVSDIVDKRRIRRSLEYRRMQVKAILTIMNCLSDYDLRGKIIDEEYLRRQNDDSGSSDVGENANLEQEQAQNVPLIPVQYEQQPQQHLYQHPHPQQKPLYQPQQHQHQLNQQPQQPQPSQPQEQYHQLQLYEQQPQQQQHKQTHSQSKPSTSVRRALSPDILARAMILGLISPSAHTSNKAGDGNARKYLKTNPPQYPYLYLPENIEDAISDEFLNYINDDNINYTLAYKR